MQHIYCQYTNERNPMLDICVADRMNSHRAITAHKTNKKVMHNTSIHYCILVTLSYKVANNLVYVNYIKCIVINILWCFFK